MKILIFNPFGIGDVLFTTPLIDNLKEGLPGAGITYICNARVYPMLAADRRIDKVIVFEKDDWRRLAKTSRWRFLKEIAAFYRGLTRARYDVVFDFSLNSRYGFFLMLTGIKKRIGFNFKRRGRFLTDKIDLPLGYRDKHTARYYLDLLKFVGIEPGDRPFNLYIDPGRKEAAAALLKTAGRRPDKKLVMICPGSGDSWGENAYFKRWPRDSFVSLCRKFLESGKVDVVLIGSPRESDICRAIAAQVPGVIDLCGKTDLPASCALVSLTDLLVTSDGGPLHIGQALCKKIIAFFGPVDENVYGAYPDAGRVKVFTCAVDCRPCYESFRFRGCDYDKRCLRGINTPEVWEAARAMLSIA